MSGPADAGQHTLEPHRRALQVHCYRMLGSFHDAEDAVQETFVRAWHGLPAFEGRASVRNWLYRIATNVCLNALAARAAASRVLPQDVGPPTDQMPDREPATDIPWLEPYPDALLEGVADDRPGPDARYELRESVHLAFVAAIQRLPPRQRAVLLLRDVMGWSAVETAELLESSVAAVNSALQRARTELQDRLPPSGARVETVSDRDRALLDRYVRAWEQADAGEFTALLKEDAVFTMPPWRQWYRGPRDIAAFFARTARPGGPAPFRLVPTRANGQMAFAFYTRWHSLDWRLHSIQIVTIGEGAIAGMTSFVVPALGSAFGLPSVLP